MTQPELLESGPEPEREVEPSRFEVPRRPVAVIAAVLLVLVALVAIADHTLDVEPGQHFSSPWSVIFLGMIIGGAYGLLGIASVLVYRRTGVINFAATSLGGLGSITIANIVTRGHSYWAVVIPAMAAAGLLSAVVGKSVHARYRGEHASHATVVTIALLLTFAAGTALVSNHTPAGSLFPSPTGFHTFNVGALRVTQPYSALLFLSLPVAVSALLGDRVIGRRWPIVYSWAMAGAIATLVSVLLAPTSAFAAPSEDTLLAPMLAVAALAGFGSVALAVVGGLVIGVVEQMLLWNWPMSRYSTDWLLASVLVIGALAWQRRVTDGHNDEASTRSAALFPQLAIGGAILVAGFVVAATVSSFHHLDDLGILVVFALLAMPIAFAGRRRLDLSFLGISIAGLLVTHAISGHTDEALAPLGGVIVVGATLALAVKPVVGRLTGWQVPVLTFGLAFLALAVLETLHSDGFETHRLVAFGHSLRSTRTWVFVCLGLLSLTTAVALWTRRSRVSDAFRYALSGSVAGVAGFALYGLNSLIVPRTLSPPLALLVLVLALTGGIGIAAGPMLGVLVVMTLPVYVELNDWQLLAVYCVPVVILFVTPDGLGGTLSRWGMTAPNGPESLPGSPSTSTPTPS